MNDSTAPTVWTPAGLADAARVRNGNALQLWLLPLDDPPWPLAELAAELDAAETARAARFHFAHDARRYTAAHGLLRRLLGAALGIAPRELRFASGPNGKPALIDGDARLAFNLSHSGSHGLVGVIAAPARVDREGPVQLGVDIEVMRELGDRDALAASHFAAEEQRALNALPEALRDAAFFAGWTRKEACVKALGGGLSIPLGDVEVTLDPRAPARLVRTPGAAVDAARWTLWSGSVGAGVCAAAALDAEAAQVHTFACA